MIHFRIDPSKPSGGAPVSRGDLVNQHNSQLDKTLKKTKTLILTKYPEVTKHETLQALDEAAKHLKGLHVSQGGNGQEMGKINKLFGK